MKLFVITGQTATGKTKLALQLAQKYNGELINCDSRQIYKYLDIITGKDIKKNSKFKIPIRQARSKIWLYDIVDPKEYFSSFNYQKIAIPLIKKILKQGKTPIIVGGTYLYLSHLLYEIDTENIPPNWKLREELNNKSVSQLQKMLIQLNVQSFNRLNGSDKNNPQRLIRKIEILSTNKNAPIGQITPRRCRLGSKLNIPNIKIEFIGLRFKNKDDLVKTIKNRVEKRLGQGAIEEVKGLLKKGYSENDPGLKTIGYKQIIQYLKRELTKKEAIDQWITKELQYAKRQYTFMKKDPNIKWRFV